MSMFSTRSSSSTSLSLQNNTNYCLLGQAGLFDRMFVYSKLGEIVHSRGGTLFVAPNPCTAFDPRHNFGKRIPCNIKWRAFFDFPPYVRPHRNEPCKNISDSEAWHLIHLKWHKINLMRDSGATIGVGLTCTQYQHLELPPPRCQFVQVRRGDVLLKMHHGFNNSVLTSIPSVDRTVREMYTPSMRLIYTTNEQSAPYLESLHTTMRSIDRDAIFFDDAMKPWCFHNFCFYCNFLNMQTSGNASIKIGGHAMWEGTARAHLVTTRQLAH